MAKKLNLKALRDNLDKAIAPPRPAKLDNSDALVGLYGVVPLKSSSLIPPPDPDERRDSSTDETISKVVAIHQPAVDSNISTNEQLVDSNISTTSKVDSHQQRTAHRRGDRHSKQNKVGKFIRLNKEIHSKIADFCHNHELEHQEFFERAALHFIEAVDIHKSDVVDIKIAHDDLMMLFKTDEDIISLYRKYLPLNKWKARDDEVGRQFNSIDRRIVEYGMLQCLLRAGKQRIHSFKYFVEEIHIIMDIHPSDEHVDAALSSLRRHWDRRREGKS